ncbi:domain containing [Trichoderma arundinaceum]|uniref:Domain containing n=1 Tax=Trichoderma arundinaceum TaxID=490622 RepID=A0A395NG71_TRIAR|nr:domain containing [Trichoderma arundinaceum]
MAPSVEAILKKYTYAPEGVQRIAHRRVKNVIKIVEPDPSWPQTFELLKSRIVSALGPTAVSVEHVGSTSVPDLPAKPIIDIDLTVKDVLDEASYVPQLEAVGFHFLLREPGWHEHRFFCEYEPATNLHVFGPDCSEAARHKIFRDWLRKAPADRDMYAALKREASEASRTANESMDEYTERKNDCVKQILDRAFRDLGYIQ